MWAAGTGSDLCGVDGTPPSKILVPSEIKCNLIGTIKDENLQETYYTIKCYRHFLNIFYSSALQNTDPKVIIQNITEHKQNH